MALATNPMILTTTFTAVGAATGTVLISQREQNDGPAEIVVADAIGDTAAQPAGHRITPTDKPTIEFYGLGSKIVYARKLNSAHTVILDVTRY